LILSPIIGFFGAAALLLIAKALIKKKELFEAPKGDAPPPLPVRLLLLLTCTGVSFAHGSNDGQKGMGLIMLIVIGMAPATYALNLGTESAVVQNIATRTKAIEASFSAAGHAQDMPNGDARHTLAQYLKKGVVDDSLLNGVAVVAGDAATRLAGKNSMNDVAPDSRRDLRIELYLLSAALDKLGKSNALTKLGVDAGQVGGLSKDLKAVTSYIPVWVKVAVAFALGLGTMIGWKRIVVTVGEKIGKSHLNYAQGASAELVAMATIEAADILGLPVSTTHVLSSGIAGTMVANGGGVQKSTIRNILLAWVLTLPVCVLLGAGLFAGGLLVFFRLLGVH
jgi:PiT family inorganic phosphate transporter